MTKLFLKFFLIIFSALLVFSLNSCKKSEKKSSTQPTTKAEQVDTSFSSEQTMLIKFKNKVFGIPSPVLVSSLVKKMDIPYEPGLLNPTSNATKYIEQFKQAVNLGIYGADLAYLNIYDQKNLIQDYYSIIKKLADQLDLLNTVNQQTLDKIEKNSENTDSLMYLVSKVFRDIDAYLTENQQQKTGALIITGGWLESVYFLTQLYSQNQNQELLTKIAEQKSPLNNLLHILEPYYNQGDKNIDQLFETLAEISSYYDAIKLQYTYDQPEVFPDKHLTIIHSHTIVNANDLDIIKISSKIKNLRSWLIN